MKKSTLLRKIQEISASLTSQSAKTAINALIEELDAYQEAPQKPLAEKEYFELPLEVSSSPKAFALYTDGACRGNPGPGSYAYMIQRFDGEIVGEGALAEKLTTNNKMELKAIIEGLRYLSSHVEITNTIFVYTDSKYVVNGMRSWIHSWKRRGWKKANNKSPENMELWKALDEASGICDVSFHWVKGHSGHPQNEYVDGLANIALDKNGY